ncbi:hypothetical protein [Brevibacterium luteolum]|uniref:Uncharacterized protein n=1 Tax=Brevibacterium luteolum TaxID=199591 RepID=A0A2N6PEP0_9MICO|nr:hypothetical protein [Brevibacterium luteolum]PMB97154.1 hypothetical protein CJ198_12655 [Brevibacterium luteolum]
MTVAQSTNAAVALADEVLARLAWNATEDDVLDAVTAVTAAHQDGATEADEDAVLALVLDELAVRLAETGDPQLS